MVGKAASSASCRPCLIWRQLLFSVRAVTKTPLVRSHRSVVRATELLLFVYVVVWYSGLFSLSYRLVKFLVAYYGTNSKGLGVSVLSVWSRKEREEKGVMSEGGTCVPLPLSLSPSLSHPPPSASSPISLLRGSTGGHRRRGLHVEDFAPQWWTKESLGQRSKRARSFSPLGPLPIVCPDQSLGTSLVPHWQPSGVHCTSRGRRWACIFNGLPLRDTRNAKADNREGG